MNILDILENKRAFYDYGTKLSILAIYEWKDIKRVAFCSEKYVKPDPYKWAVCRIIYIDNSPISVPIKYFNTLGDVVEEFNRLRKMEGEML